MATGAFPTATESSTTLDVLIPEIWSDKINDFYRANLIAAKFFTDLSDELANGGDVLHIPNLSAMTAHSKTNATVVTLKCWGQGLTIRLISNMMDIYKNLCLSLNASVVGLN